jgi:hypothetical protein
MKRYIVPNARDDKGTPRHKGRKSAAALTFP